MTTIAPFAAGSYATSRNTSQLLGLKSQLNDLSSQLTTGLTGQTYGGLGTGRSSALAAQASISALTGYSAIISTAQTRAKLATTSLSQVVSVATDTNNALQNGLQSTAANSEAAKSTALNDFSAALDALNQSDGSVYLFSGGASSTAPVLDADTILNGSTGKDGLRTVVSEQVSADLGTGGKGRMTVTAPGGTTPAGAALSTSQVALAADASATSSPAFGFAIAGGANAPQATGSAIGVAQTSGNPAAYTFSVTGQPAAGDSVTFTLTLPDGTSTTRTLTAVAGTTANANSTTTFAIGGTPAATAANLSTAFGSALTDAAQSTLTASATARATTDFFNASAKAGTTPQRVYYDTTTGEPSYTHTANSTTGIKNTVVWYQGEDSATQTSRSDASATQTLQIGSSATVQLGARANELPIRAVLAGLATVALGMPSSTASNVNAVYQAVSAKASTMLSSASTSPSVQDIVTDFSLASARMSDASTANTAQKSALQDTVDGIEQAPTEEVATKLMDVQNRLQASYQITATLSKLSLVNYLTG